MLKIAAAGLATSFGFWCPSLSAQNACSAQGDKALCQTALGAVSSTSGPSASSSSLAEASANQSAASGAQYLVLKDALDYCENRKARCQANCSPDMKQTGTIGKISVMENSKIGPLLQQCNDILQRGRLPASVTCPASPLILQVGGEPIELTSPEHGVWFDILGQNATPAHRANKISWLVPSSRPGSYFLTLPNAEGRVLGVDQLFGNNTRGPDEAYAPNGFAALRKFDGWLANGIYDPMLRDNRIDAQDPIYARLRLWHDLNGDGIADADELETLAQVGVIEIDLDAVPFAEADGFGNSLVSRSLVRMRDQSSRVMFDLWFAL